TMPHLPIFVYGTLLPGQPNAHLWQQPGATTQPAALPNARLYSMGYYPMLVETDDDALVHGALISLPRAAHAATLARLDALEGYDPDAPDAPGYRRVERRVRLANGRFTPAWLYAGQPDLVAGQPPIPDGDWLAYAAAHAAELAAWWAAVESVAGRHGNG
ncbi:MAG: gamma-glutamylcyclotransferase, partial [Anaerolineales bacterium]|nr:gamma-glutamylcyclotransferase [Anaerolineales bacterium]